MKLADMIHRAAVVCLAGEHLRGRRDIRQRLPCGVVAAPPPALTPAPPRAFAGTTVYASGFIFVRLRDIKTKAKEVEVCSPARCTQRRV
jgi:hypothetical protein